MTKRINKLERSTVILSYQPAEAEALRKMVSSITLGHGTKPSMSLVSRRALQLYGERLQRLREVSRDAYEAEIAELEKLVTPIPRPAKRSRKAA